MVVGVDEKVAAAMVMEMEEVNKENPEDKEKAGGGERGSGSTS